MIVACLNGTTEIKNEVINGAHIAIAFVVVWTRERIPWWVTVIIFRQKREMLAVIPSYM